MRKHPEGEAMTENDGVAGANAGSGRVLVIGSVNHDHCVTIDRLPAPGETVPATDMWDGLGGKGANQAVAASLAGAHVTFAGAVGDDASGRLAVETLDQFGVDNTSLRTVSGRTGTAYISIDSTGENVIVVHAGANATVGADIADLLDSTAPAVVVTQGELPLEAIAAAADVAAARGSKFLLNLAPVVRVPEDVLAAADPLVVNEHEAAAALDQRPPQTVAAALRMATELAKGCRSVVMTLGSAGAVVVGADGVHAHVPSPPPPGRVVDTTGAGDAFVGFLAARLARGDDLIEAATWAARAASISVARWGTLASYPTRDEVDGQV